MNLITVDNVSKRYFLKKDVQRTFKSTVLGLFGRKASKDELWAVKDVSFSVKPGETLGIIGCNGAGKSTLLGLMAGTIRPTSGSVSSRGRMSMLLELGAGFHPDLTGRENIFLNGLILGIAKKEIEKRFDRIVQFAGLEQFIDMPVKHYSSGMYVRLGFSIATEIDPDVILIDEVLAVGDENFRKKSLGRICDFKKTGKAMVIVSHDLETVKRISDRVLLLGEGTCIDIGEPHTVVSEYVNLGLQQQDNIQKKQWGNKEAILTDIKLYDGDGSETDTFISEDPLVIEIHYDTQRRIPQPVFGFSICDYQGSILYGNNTQDAQVPISHIEDAGVIRLSIPKIPFLRGKYFFSFSLHSNDHKTNYHRLDHWKKIWVKPKEKAEGIVRLPHSWEIFGKKNKRTSRRDAEKT